MRSTTKGIKLMFNTFTLAKVIAVIAALAWSTSTFAQDNNGASQASQTTTQTRTVGDGIKLKIEGIVIKREPTTMTLREPDGTETAVFITHKTTIKTVRRGLFRKDKTSTASDIVRGLRLKVEGTGDADGLLVASRISFDEQDLNTAQSIESRVDPVETQANSTQALAEINQNNIAEAQRRLDESEQNAQRLSGQVDELSSVANTAATAANNAQASADRAQADANNANGRINALGDYDLVKTVTVYFKPGSAVLSRAAKSQLDEAAAEALKAQVTGRVISVVGYADSTGKSAENRSLSERRANAVINYLVTVQNLPLQRLVQPFGYGSLNPIAGNDTRAGRARNRRAEIRVLANKGISAEASVQQSSSNGQISPQP